MPATVLDTSNLAPPPMLQPTTSQRHLAALISTFLDRECLSSTVRILDVGCGDGRLLAYLAQVLPQQHPERRFQLYGFEVGDIGWHGEDYLQTTTSYLKQHTQGMKWDDRISVYSASQPWKYAAETFDIIISNQVLEHVQDHASVLGEIFRCLVPGGISAHLFPLRETLYEVHAHMPLVHWIRDPDRQRKIMLLFARLGFRRTYRQEMQFRGWKTLPEFAAAYSGVLGTMTNYKTHREIRRLGEDAGFQVDSSYTATFFTGKLLSFFGRTRERYEVPGWIARASVGVLLRLASVTLILRKPTTPQAR